MNEQEIHIIVEIIEEAFGIEVPGERAKSFIDSLDSTRNQMSFVDTKESEIKKYKTEVNLSLCCESPISWRKLSGSVGHGEYYCTCCSRARNV